MQLVLNQTKKIAFCAAFFLMVLFTWPFKKLYGVWFSENIWADILISSAFDTLGLAVSKLEKVRHLTFTF